MGWLFWQQQVLMVVLSYGFHLIDTVAMVLAIVIDLDSLGSNNHLVIAMTSGIFIWNCVVVGLYGMIALGELLVMRLRFFKIVWHDITLMIVVMGMVDLIVNSAMSDLRQMQSGYRGRLFIRLIFIISRNIRLLSMVETVPCLLRSLIKLLEKRISGHLGVGFDICCAYVTGQGEVVRQLDSMVNEPSIRDDLKHTCNRHKMDIIRTLGILALENPTIALSVKTRQAMRIVLNAQHDTVMQLKGDGALLETDASLLSKDLEERMKRVLNSPPLVEDDSLDNIVKNLGWVQGDDELFRFLKDNLDIYHLKANSAVAEQDSEDFNIYIIGSGVGRLEHITGAFDVNVLDYLTAGNTVGELSFLTKSMRHKTVRCETAVTVLALREEVMERVLKMKWNPDLPPVLYRMWLVIAKRVAIKVILDNPEYQGMSTERLRMQIYNGFLIDDQVGTSFAIHSDPADAVILIHGYARDAFTRQPFQGPCFIPSSCFQLTLLPEEGLYTLVLVIPNEPVELAEYNINPTRRGSQIDASVLGLASEGNTGMRLEDICRNSATPYRDEDVESSCRQATRASESDDEAMSSSCSSDEGASYGQHSETHSRPEQQEVIISHPSEAAGSTNKLHPPPQHRSHVPAGATWEISDTWDRMTSLLQSRPDSRKISDADKRFKSSGSDDSGSDD
ncbi:sperm-specific sodium:proton exchanger-like [Babylonia areolata]|uniref:sperm-specific sodium:proton exchanger-like n=1 Tax=Babylonia areolata TaxID=304850 RepID=UPI003FD3B4C1